MNSVQRQISSILTSAVLNWSSRYASLTCVYDWLYWSVGKVAAFGTWLISNGWSVFIDPCIAFPSFFYNVGWSPERAFLCTKTLGGRLRVESEHERRIFYSVPGGTDAVAHALSLRKASTYIYRLSRPCPRPFSDVHISRCALHSTPDAG